MRKKLLKGVRKLCSLYPQLRGTVTYSQVLSQREVNVFALFANGHVQDIIHEFPVDEAAQARWANAFLSGSTGVSTIRKQEVDLVEMVLLAASSNEPLRDLELRDTVDFLRSHRKVWWELHQVYEKIVQNRLVGSCPLVTAPPSVLDWVVPFGVHFHRFQEFHKLFHGTIHHVLERNDLRFDDRDLREGVVAYFHEKVMGPRVRLHYNGDVGERMLRNAARVGRILDKYPRTAVIPLLRRL